MSQKMQLTPGSTTVFHVPSAAGSPPPAYSGSELQPAMASSGTSPSGSSSFVAMVPPLPMTRSWSGSRSGSRSRSRSGSPSHYSRSHSRSSRPRSRRSSSRSSARSSYLSSSSKRSLLVNAARKSTMPFTRLPAGLDQKTAGYWVLALAIFCLASSSALVATLLNRTAASQAGLDEESNAARNEPSLHLREETRLPENFEFAVHFGRRRTTQSTTRRKPPFFTVTVRPRSRATAATFPWTVTEYPGEYTKITEPTDEYPETVPGEVTEPPDPVTVNPGDIPTPENTTDESGNATEHVTERGGATTEITEAGMNETNAVEGIEAVITVENTEATSKETKALATSEAESTGEITEAGSEEMKALATSEAASTGVITEAASEETKALGTSEAASTGVITEAASEEMKALGTSEAVSTGEITETARNETKALAKTEAASTGENTEAASNETEALTSAEDTTKANARILDVYDDNNFDLLRKVVPAP
ncbi:hypothetical protein MTO96_036656 [Rhipicephalus appendiculatus]